MAKLIDDRVAAPLDEVSGSPSPWTSARDSLEGVNSATAAFVKPVSDAFPPPARALGVVLPGLEAAPPSKASAQEGSTTLTRTGTGISLLTLPHLPRDGGRSRSAVQDRHIAVQFPKASNEGDRGEKLCRRRQAIAQQEACRPECETNDCETKMQACIPLVATPR
jgi:hypothetical protein